MKNKKITASGLVSSITLTIAMIVFIQSLKAPSPADSLGHKLTAGALLMVGGFLVFRPGNGFLYVAAFEVILFSTLTLAEGPIDSVTIGLAQALIALAAVGLAAGHSRDSNPV